jgi:hypothetical protein
MITCTALSVLCHYKLLFHTSTKDHASYWPVNVMTQVQASGIWRKWKRKFRPGNPEGSPLHTSNSGRLILECSCCLNGFFCRKAQLKMDNENHLDYN